MYVSAGITTRVFSILLQANVTEENADAISCVKGGMFFSVVAGRIKGI